MALYTSFFVFTRPVYRKIMTIIISARTSKKKTQIKTCFNIHRLKWLFLQVVYRIEKHSILYHQRQMLPFLKHLKSNKFTLMNTLFVNFDVLKF
jgi:hypothetical protein